MSISGASLSEVDIEDCNVNKNVTLEKINKKIDEIIYKKIEKKKCKAQGAWFYKIEQEKPDDSIGISATFNLPKFEHDPNRYFTNKANVHGAHTVGPLDKASVYLGGQIGGAELDAGLSWDRVYDNQNNPTDRFAFRPFWRATEKLNSKTEWHNPDLTVKVLNDREIKVKNICDKRNANNGCSSKNRSFEQPGTEMNMSLQIVEKQENKYIIEMKIADRDNPGNCFVTCFEHLGIPGKNDNSWKRVSSIDQFTLGPCYTSKDGSLTTNKSEGMKDENGKYIPYKKKVKKNVGGKDTFVKVDTEPQDCRLSRETQKANVLGTTAKLKHMNWKSVELLNKDKKSTTALTTHNSKRVLGKEFCNNNTNLKEKEHFNDESGGINQFGGQSLNIIPKELPKSNPIPKKNKKK